MTKSRRQTICVDFDGVLHSYTSGWKGAATIPDPPVPGAIQWLTALTDVYDVVVCSSRARVPWGWLAIRCWLAREMFRYWGAHPVVADDALARIKVQARKPKAIVYVDDRAWRFDGKHFPSPGELATHRPWCAKETR